MKNYLFWAIAVIAITFSSCKDDDEKDALSGTTWVCNEEVPGFDEGSRTIQFHTNGKCSVEVIETLMEKMKGVLQVVENMSTLLHPFQ